MTDHAIYFGSLWLGATSQTVVSTSSVVSTFGGFYIFHMSIPSLFHCLFQGDGQGPARRAQKVERLWCLCVRTTVGSNPSQEKSDHRKKDDLINRGGSDDADPRWVRSRFGHVEAVEIAAVGGLVGSQAVSVRTYQDPQGIMDTP